MPTVPQTPAQYHYTEAERTLALLGSIGATEEEATREAIVALTHAALAVAAAVLGRDY
jgi:hypothetical protein